MSLKTQQSFIDSVQESESQLLDLGFIHKATVKHGYATYIDFKNKETLITFIFGPSDWHVEILITTQTRKFAFKDLLQNSTISHWVTEHAFVWSDNKLENLIKDEVLWWINLLKFAIPIIDPKFEQRNQ